jgi:hypothetical protein
MKEQLSDLEITKIEQFCADTEMFEAVKKGILVGLYSHGVIKAGFKHDPLQNGALSLAALAVNNPIPDEQLGQHIRSVWLGINALENAYKGLENIKIKKEEIVTPYNEAI